MEESLYYFRVAPVIKSNLGAFFESRLDRICSFTSLVVTSGITTSFSFVFGVEERQTVCWAKMSALSLLLCAHVPFGFVNDI